jgi:NADH-quinone oxidoreductase subunit L
MAQNDIKRILAYSTVSQLGYMMVGLATGGVAVGMFHLITHAFFKALLFLGAGSVIHGCHDEQDIRTMGGLRKEMPATFYTYMVGMLALSGFPIFFSGFWSKDAIVGSAHNWVGSQGPFWMLLTGALLTAFYMTRQIALVFFGKWRGDGHAHESPLVMTAPLGILAFFAVVLGVLGTPAWPWFTGFLESRAVPFDWAGFAEPGLLPLMGVASLIVFAGLGLGWMLYGSKPRETAEALDPVERALPTPFGWLAHRLYFDELYGVTVLRWYGWLAGLSGWLDTAVWGGLVALVAGGFRELGRVNKAVDTKWIDGSFDKGCEELVTGGGVLAWLQAGRSPGYLRLLAFGVLVLAGLALLASAVSGQVRL